MAWKYFKVAPLTVSVRGDEQSRREAIDVAVWNKNLPGTLAFALTRFDQKRCEAAFWKWTAFGFAVVAAAELVVILCRRYPLSP